MMGMLKISMWGSFPQRDVTFAAQESGHAVAVDDAIEYLKLAKENAVEIDQRLMLEGHEPDDGFGEANKRGLIP